jgi:hypothetical protein
MKKTLLSILVAITFTLSGCSMFGNTDMISINTEDVTVFNTHYDFESPTLDIYRVSEENKTDYVSVRNYLDLMDPALVELKFKEKGDLTILIPYYFRNEIVKEFKVILNPEDNSIYIENFYMFLNLNDELNIDYIFQFTSETDVIGEFEDPSVTIDLDDYNFTIEKNKKDFFIPIYIANLLFSGSTLNLYSNNGEYYLVEDFSTFDNLIDSDLPDSIDEQTIIDDTTNYLSLVLDYYYGMGYFLKNYYISSNTLETNGVSNSTSLVEQANIIQTMILNSPDLHTSIYRPGYNQNQIAVPVLDTSSELSTLYDELDNYQCRDRDYEILFEELDDYFILRINSFTLDTKDFLIEAFDNINPNKDIVIDLSCNLGGTLGGMFDLISFMTNEDFFVSQVNGLTDQQTRTTYTPYKRRGLENNFIVYTSGVSYSAANVFSAVVQRNGLGYVIGEATRGGGAAVGITVLPNGMVFRYSSTGIFTTSDFKSIEYGINPNEIVESSDVDSAIDKFYSRLQNYFVFDITDTTYHCMVQLNYSITEFLPMGNEVTKYKIEVFNSNNHLMFTSTYDTNEFFFRYNARIIPYLTIKISVLVKYGSNSFYIPLEETTVFDPDIVE